MPSVRDIEGSIWVEILVRAVLALIFIELEGATPFTRKIHPDELWLYKNPRSESYISTSVLWPLVFLTPTAVILFVFLLQKDRTDVSQAVLGCSLGLSLNGVFTDIMKLIVGRPRPDFFWRCFPDGEVNPELKCTGEESVINEGRKSFPSGHSSFSFVSMGFIAFYLAGKLHIFSSVGRGKSWRLCAFLLPLSIALVVALSRTCDYHHHWQGKHCVQWFTFCESVTWLPTYVCVLNSAPCLFVGNLNVTAFWLLFATVNDVLCGSLLGISISYLCYRQYYPSLTSIHSHIPYAAITPHLELEAVRSSHSCIQNEEQIKWI